MRARLSKSSETGKSSDVIAETAHNPNLSDKRYSFDLLTERLGFAFNSNHLSFDAVGVQ